METDNTKAGVANSLDTVVLKPIPSSELNRAANRSFDRTSDLSDESSQLPLNADRESILKFINNLMALIEANAVLEPAQSNGNNSSKQKTSPSRNIHANNMKHFCDQTLKVCGVCLAYSTDSLPPHQRFRFRELVLKLEKNVNCLRSMPNVSNENVVMANSLNEIGANMRDIVAVVGK